MKKNMIPVLNYWSICCALLFICSSAVAQIKTVIPASVNAAERITVTNKSTAEVSFNLGTLPAGCTVDSCSLQFASKDPVETAVLLEVYPAGSTKMVNSRMIKKGYKDGTPLNLEIVDKTQFPVPNGTYTVKLQIGSNSPGAASLYGSAGKSDAEQGYAPRLIVYYSFAGKTEPFVDWGLSNANAQHNSQSFMSFRGAISNEYKATELKSMGPIKMNLLLYKSNLYMFCNTSLYSINTSSQRIKELRSGLIAPAELTIPAIDEKGRLYYASNNGISVIELENNVYHQDKIKTTSIVNNALTIGADGSLYVPAENSVSAYTSFPQNRLIWSSRLSGAKSAVTLNKEGTIAYVVSFDKNALIALDANNGREIYTQPLQLIKEKNPPVPVLDANGDVYVTNKLTGGTILYIFKAGLQGTPKVIEGSQLSMPAASAGGGVFVLNNGKLMKYSYEETKSIHQVDGLTDVRSMVTDQSDNVYCLGLNHQFYAFMHGKEKDVKPLKVEAVFAMIMGTDGTLYTAAINNVITISPQTFNDDYALTSAHPEDENHDYLTFRGDKIHTEKEFLFIGNRILSAKSDVKLSGGGQVKKDANVVVNAGGNILFQKGFLVKKGGRLVCKTGVIN